AKPDDSLFRYCMWYLQGTPEDTVFVGNRVTDIPKWAQHGYLYTHYDKKHSGHTDFPGKEVQTIREILEDLDAKTL
ncbi:hypothetical protein LRR18_16780, partial [Mangrovimonas sp. AS39]|uniref:hypothetical protein n=1 Tax=Mangrovimonas futianensis TaxID=2895523 RepID=UPI001E5EF57E